MRPSAVPAPYSPLVLIVDDTNFVRELYAKMLSTSGYRTVVAKGGVEALALLAKQEVDLVLLDYTMPQMNGVEVLLRMRQNPKTAKVPVIILTASDLREHEKLGMMAGADDYITKPVPRGALLERIGRILEARRGSVPKASGMPAP